MGDGDKGLNLFIAGANKHKFFCVCLLCRFLCRQTMIDKNQATDYIRLEIGF